MAALKALRKRIEQYGEPWEGDHKEVMANHDAAESLTEEASYGVYLYSRLRTAIPQNFQESRALYEAYVWWYNSSLQLLRSIEKSDARDFKAEGVKDFRSAFREANLFIGEIRQRREAMDTLIRGEGIPANEFINGLRHRSTA